MEHTRVAGAVSAVLVRAGLAVGLASMVGLAAACARQEPEPTWTLTQAVARTAPATGGMVTTTDPVATDVGMAVLARGGNAIDAAVATHFALAVVNPEAGNIGGGGFLVARMTAGETVALDFRETAPAAASRDMFLGPDGQATDASVVGHLAAGVPGSVAGMWEAHRRFGSLPWADLVAPAIELADGLVVHDRLGTSLASATQRLSRYASTAAVFLPGGAAPAVGERFAQAALAATLRRVAADGRDGFYRGRTAELVDAEMRRGGGVMTAADLAAYEAKWRDPLRFEYRGHAIVSMPPPSSGGVTLAEILNVLEGYDLRASGFLSADHVHVYAEAAKRAFADRNTYLGDPDFVSQPIERMASDAYAVERRTTIDMAHATPSTAVEPGLGVPGGGAGAVAEGAHTTHYSIVDGAGNAVAVTTTINSLYGNLVTVTGAGFLLNNEMDDFAAKPGSPNQFGLVQGEANAVQPGKRMLSAMAPTIVLRPDGRLWLVTGSPGGPTIISTVAQTVSQVIDFDMDLVQATSSPRLHHQHLPDRLMFEKGGLPADRVEALRARGQVVEERGGYQGDTQSILIAEDGTRIGVGDPRRTSYR
ncbi:MAG: gamma-glutamyltransferase [Acidobacteria bacterium]|nr:gamma-glutamyltransferase [Acidobacteriota bacterium]